jgi:serine protease Do
MVEAVNITYPLSDIKYNIRRQIVKKTILSFILFMLSAISARAAVGMIPASFATVAEKIKESVVNISTVTVIRQGGDSQMSDPFFNDEFFNRFFGVPQGTFKSRSLGTGFIVSPDGFILTNNHVVDRADEITVKLYNQKEYKAKIVGRDKDTDIAVIKINAGGLIPAALGDSDKISVGDWVVAVGSPFGLEQTVTQGIISAKGRIIGAGPYDDFLQTDAAINPGNSGGPLCNLDGEVIGINSAITSNSGGYEGVGFAIPVNMAKKVYSDIMQKGKVVRGWLGVSIQELTPELAKHFKVREGVLIAQVFKGGPAAKAGIQQGDVVVEFDGKKVGKYRELQALVASTQTGRAVDITVMRNGTEKMMKINIGERDLEAMNAPMPPKPQETANDIGITAGEITADSAEQYGLTAKQGVIVINVAQDSAAEDGGVMTGDVIHEINGIAVKNMKDFDEAVKSVKKGREAVLLIERRDSMVYLAFTAR